MTGPVPPVHPDDKAARARIAEIAEALGIPQDLPSVPDGLPGHWSDAAPLKPAATGCLGAVAYQAYCESSDGKSLITGAPLPTWDDQVQAIQDAWDCAAHAVARHVRGGR